VPATLQQLRHRIARLEGFAPATSAPTLSTGFAALDAALPWSGLPRGAAHEILCPDAADGAATGFALALVSRALAAEADKPALWVDGNGDLDPPLFAPGLRAAGVDPGRLIFVHCRAPSSALAAIEDGLRCTGLAAVAGEIGAVDFTASRRLQLAAAALGGTLLLLRPARFAATASAAVTRWRVAACPGGGRTVELLRCRAGQPGRWELP
jgi:protein ImuA